MKSLNRVLVASLAVLLFAGLAAAQQKPEQKEEQIVPLKVEIVLSEYAGTKKISSLPYTLTVDAVGHGQNPGMVATQLRLHTNFPIPGRTGRWHAGTDIDCRARVLSVGLYQLNLILHRSSAHSSAQASSTNGTGTGNEGQTMAGTKPPPTTQDFYVSDAIILRDGQTDDATAATDPVTGHVLRVSVTLHVVKSAS